MDVDFHQIFTESCLQTGQLESCEKTRVYDFARITRQLEAVFAEDLQWEEMREGIVELGIYSSLIF